MEPLKRRGNVPWFIGLGSIAITVLFSRDNATTLVLLLFALTMMILGTLLDRASWMNVQA